MAIRPTLGEQLITANLRLHSLLAQSTLVGGIYTMGYADCLVLTNDIWKHGAGGIPQHCFLLATAFLPGQAPHADEEEIILLRVAGPAQLPAEDELVAIRAEAMREIVTTTGRASAAEPAAIVDVLTRNEMQFSALKAKVLGTFFETDVNGSALLSFGSDIESYHSASRYRVYKPFGASLAAIASYPEVTREEELRRQEAGTEPQRVRIGTIRYTSTPRRGIAAPDQEAPSAVPVRVNIEDFIALKTAIFGMTRLGKSNTMKIIATAVFEHSMLSHEPIGQLLFDPAGEYANVNVQDQTALSQIGPDYVTVFRYGARPDEPGLRPLSLNFYSDETIEVGWSVICSGLAWRAPQAGYIRDFLAADVVGPETDEDRSEWTRARQRRAALFATLRKAGFQPPRDLRVRLAAGQEVREAVNGKLRDAGRTPVEGDRHGVISLDREYLLHWFEALNQARSDPHFPADWVDTRMASILAMLEAAGIRGYRELQTFLVFHSPHRRTDYAQEILDELVAGKIVIVDLSRGTETVLQYASERIVNHILIDSAARFAAGQEPRRIQIYIEEAHRLFGRDRMKMPDEADPYVRLAKEAAKFKIGLVYATQEVSSVDPVILSNTSNWVVTHLNNHAEVRELSKYYDFEDFAQLTLQAEDVGFVRLKTKSGRYIVPTQVDLFDPERIQRARRVAIATAVEGN